MNKAPCLVMLIGPLFWMVRVNNFNNQQKKSKMREHHKLMKTRGTHMYGKPRMQDMCPDPASCNSVFWTILGYFLFFFRFQLFWAFSNISYVYIYISDIWIIFSAIHIHIIYIYIQYVLVSISWVAGAYHKIFVLEPWRWDKKWLPRPWLDKKGTVNGQRSAGEVHSQTHMFT